MTDSLCNACLFFVGTVENSPWLPDIAEATPSVTAALTKYRDVGRILAEDRSGHSEILEALHSIRTAESLASPYVVVDAPSGSGKTQLGFVLASLGCHVLHFPLFPPSESSQHVYLAMLNVALNIDLAVREDTTEITDPSDGRLNSSCLRHGVRPLRLVQYFFRFFFGDIDRPLNQCRVAHFRDALSALSTAILPVVIVDEVGNSRNSAGAVSDAEVTRVRYIRNLCRALHIPCVLMGTNSNATNIADAVAGSRSCGPILWCKLITRLPRVPQSRDALGLPTALTILQQRGHHHLATLLDETAMTANPLFLSVLVEGTQRLKDDEWQRLTSSRDVLEELLATTARWLLQRKSGLLTSDGLYGQVALQQNMHRGTSTDVSEATIQRMDSAVLVGAHFARLNAPRDITDLFLNGQMLLTSVEATLEIWKPTASFATASDDPWLYLLCGGGIDGRHPPAFAQRNNSALGTVMSTADAFHSVQQYLQKQGKQPLLLANAEAQKRDGDVLEALVGVAMVIASRRAGVGGMSLSHFMCRLAEELVRSDKYPLQRSVAEWSQATFGALLDAQLGAAVPYLGAINARWPAALLDIPDCLFGHFRRISNSEMVDFAVSFPSPSTWPVTSAASASAAASTASEPPVSPPCPPEAILMLGECRNDDDPLQNQMVEAVLLRALARHRDDAHHRVHLVFASNLSHALFAKSSWTSWKKKHAKGVHLEVARVDILHSVTREGPSLHLSLANVSSTIPCPQGEDPCDLLVLFVPVESWLNTLAQRATKQAQTARSEGDATASTSASKRRRTG